MLSVTPFLKSTAQVHGTSLGIRDLSKGIASSESPRIDSNAPLLDGRQGQPVCPLLDKTRLSKLLSVRATIDYMYLSGRQVEMSSRGVRV